MKATPSPTKRTLSVARIIGRSSRCGEPSRFSNRMSGGLIACGMCGMGFSPSASTSAPVRTSSTPGILNAAAASIETMRAWACVERSTKPRAWFGRVKSSE